MSLTENKRDHTAAGQIFSLSPPDKCGGFTRSVKYNDRSVEVKARSVHGNLSNGDEAF